jgi:hypothetical protein
LEINDLHGRQQGFVSVVEQDMRFFGMPLPDHNDFEQAKD